MFILQIKVHYLACLTEAYQNINNSYYLFERRVKSWEKEVSCEDTLLHIIILKVRVSTLNHCLQEDSKVSPLLLLLHPCVVVVFSLAQIVEILYFGKYC